MSKTAQEFFDTRKISNIKPSYYYTDYQVVAKHLSEFEELLDVFGTIQTSKEFISILRTQYESNNSIIRIVPLFTGVRPDKLVVLDGEGNHVEKFNSKTVTFEQAISFLEEVGFLERILEMAPFNLKSYFFGVNVGLDSNGRKNRSGKQMEMIVESYIKGTKKEYTDQATIKKVNAKWGTSFVDTNKKKKKFDFVIKEGENFYFIETNFFNGGGSKTDINSRYIPLVPYLDGISKNIKFIVITDGRGLQISEITDLMAKIDNVWNIDDLENNILESEII